MKNKIKKISTIVGSICLIAFYGIFMSYKPDATYKKVEVGFSLGFLSGTSSYDGIIESVIKKGNNHFRVYEIFTKGFDTNVVAICDKIQYLTKYGTADVLICVSNIPFSWIGDYSQSEINSLSSLQKKKLSYTNRFFPKRIKDYQDLIRNLCLELQKRDILRYCSFELANEHDASQYFFGTFDQFKQLNLIKYEVLKDFKRPIYLGDFTSSLMRDSSYKNKGEFFKYIMTDTIFKYVNFSHSFYWGDSQSKTIYPNFDINNNNYPQKSFSDTWITEYNIYTSFNPGSPRDSVFNSKSYVNYLCDFLKFIYPIKEVTRFYVHPLCSFPYEDAGKMSLYEKKTQAGTNYSYYTIKPAGTYFFLVYNIIKDGYYVLPNGIKGTKQSITFDFHGDWFISNN